MRTQKVPSDYSRSLTWAREYFEETAKWPDENCIFTADAAEPIVREYRRVACAAMMGEIKKTWKDDDDEATKLRLVKEELRRYDTERKVAAAAEASAKQETARRLRAEKKALKRARPDQAIVKNRWGYYDRACSHEGDYDPTSHCWCDYSFDVDSDADDYQYQLFLKYLPQWQRDFPAKYSSGDNLRG